MLSRVNELVGPKEVTITTFHSFCKEIIETIS